MERFVYVQSQTDAVIVVEILKIVAVYVREGYGGDGHRHRPQTN